jgi:hypothetical protein
MRLQSNEDLPTIWKTKLRSAIDEPDWDFQEKHCLDNSIVGIGWRVPEMKSGAAFEDVFDHVFNFREKGWGSRAAYTIRRFAREAEIGEFIWTRNLSGRYRLCKITGPYRYVNDADSKRADVHQVRDVEWAPEDVNDLVVPGGVVRNFVGTSSSSQRISDEPSRVLTPAIWEQLHGREVPKLDISYETVVEKLLDMYDAEDLVYLWLQVERNFLAAPRSRERSTPVYEFTMIHRTNSRRGIVQVKTGGSKVNLTELARAADPTIDAFAFAACGQYEGDPKQITEVIELGHLIDFANKNRDLLPGRIRAMFELAD